MISLVSFEIFRFYTESQACFKSRNALKTILSLSFADFAMTIFVIVARLGIGRDDAFEVTENNSVGRLTYDVIGHNRNLSAAAGSVYDKGRNAESAGMSAESFHYLYSLRNGRSEMLESFAEIALINVIRTNSHHYKLMNEISHNVNAVVYSGKKYALVSEGNTGVGKHSAGAPGVFGNLIGMVKVSIQPNRMILFKHIAKLGSYSLRTNDRYSRTDSYDFYVRNGSEFADDMFEIFVGKNKRVASAQKNVADFLMLSYVIYTFSICSIGRA